jgi:hypothetical protein
MYGGYRKARGRFWHEALHKTTQKSRSELGSSTLLFQVQDGSALLECQTARLLFEIWDRLAGCCANEMSEQGIVVNDIANWREGMNSIRHLIKRLSSPLLSSPPHF